MELKKLEDLFYLENSHLLEVLDKDKAGSWTSDKTRGYGVVVCSYQDLRFGIPLRSRINHKFCFLTKDDKGLDFSKSVLLLKDEYISVKPFIIPADERNLLLSKSHFILGRFSHYVERYVFGWAKADKNILRDYRYTTLVNYHIELGLK